MSVSAFCLVFLARRSFDRNSSKPLSLSAKISGRSGLGVAELGEAVSPELEARDDAIIATAAVAQCDTVEWAAHGVQAMDKVAWMALHKVLHQFLAVDKASGGSGDGEADGVLTNGHNSRRLKDLEKLIKDCRQSWQKNHSEQLQALQSRCNDLAEQLEEKTTSEELLTVELSAMRQQGVDWKQAAVSSEVQKVKKKLKQAEVARDAAEKVGHDNGDYKGTPVGLLYRQP